MGIAPAELAELKQLATAAWLEAQKIICAYQREFRKSRRLSNFLKIATLVCATITAGAAALEKTQMLGVAGGFLTAAAAILTAASVAIEQSFSPTKNVQEIWNSTVKLDDIKRELISILYKLQRISDFDTGFQAIEALSRRVSENKSIPIDVTAADESEADKALQTSVISKYVFIQTAQVENDDDLPQEEVTDAPEIITISRGRA